LFALPDDDEPSFLAFLLQQLFVPLASFLALLMVAEIVSEIPWKFVDAGMTGQIIDVVSSTMVSAAAGLLLGSAVRRLFPKARSSGKWIAALPLILMTWALVSDTFTFSFSKTLVDLFFPGPNGENWWAFMLLTCPTISALFYSAAMAWPMSARKPAASH
jgi:hypothetical protein